MNEMGNERQGLIRAYTHTNHIRSSIPSLSEVLAQCQRAISRFREMIQISGVQKSGMVFNSQHCIVNNFSFSVHGFVDV